LLFLIKSSKQKSASAIIGQALLWLKPHLLLPLLIFEINTPLVLLAIFTCLLGALGLVLSCLFGGVTIISNYIHLLASDEIYGNLLGLIYSPTLRGQLLKLSCDQFIAIKITMIIYSFLLIFSLLMPKRIKLLNKDCSTAFTTIVPLTLCLAPHLHNYDLLLLIPSIVLLSSYSLTGFLFRLRLFIIGLMALVFIIPIYVALHYFYVLRGGLINPFFWTTLVYAIGALIIEWRRPTI